MKKLTKRDYLAFLAVAGLVFSAVYENQKIQADHPTMFARPLSADEMKTFANKDPKAVVIYDSFTQAAYQPNGFYPKEKNGTYPQFTTISLQPMGINASYVSSINSFKILQELQYPIITDIDVDQHPDILNYYDKIILLHNEYMTKREFDAISSHKNVIYLYPNSAYAQVSVDYNKWQMNLIQGHGYPTRKDMNGFGFVTTSKNEYDLDCKNWRWEKMPNGIQLTCWPEFLVLEDRSLLQQINDYPQITPNLIDLPNSNYAPINSSSLPNCQFYGYCGAIPGNGLLNSTENGKN